MPKPKGPSRCFHRCPRRLGAGPRVHVVDDDPAELVDDQVHPAHGPADECRGGLARVERYPERAGEVVPRAERDQPQRAFLQLVTTVQRRDDGVQAAVTACDHDAAATGPVQDPVELSGVAGLRDLDVDVLAQHAEGGLEGRGLATTCVGVGDDEDWIHADTVDGATVFADPYDVRRR
jgi:hypothetical protein